MATPEDPPVDFDALSYQELQEECRKAHLASSGTKQKLKQRLRAKHSRSSKKRSDVASGIEEDSAAVANNNNNDGDDTTGPPHNKKRKSPADDLICAITLELPFDPVMAEDGRIYERAAIEEHIRRNKGQNLKSPMTNNPMGTNLIPAIQTKNLIETHIENGDIQGPLVDNWKESKKERDAVEKLKQQAEAGDADAAYTLGLTFQYGKNGVVVDRKAAVYWYKKASDGRNIKGMACAAYYILQEQGEKVNDIALMCFAAQGGSDLACVHLGRWYSKGLYGFTVDNVQAAHWYGKADSGTCAYKHTNASLLEEALNWLEDYYNTTHID